MENNIPCLTCIKNIKAPNDDCNDRYCTDKHWAKISEPRSNLNCDMDIPGVSFTCDDYSPIALDNWNENN